MVVFTGKTIGKQFAFTIKPFIYRSLKMVTANKAARRAISHTVLAHVESEQTDVVLSPWGADGKHTATNTVEKDNLMRMPFEEMGNAFCDRIIQFGYIVLFAPAFPLAPFLAFINNVIEIRTSGLKFCSGFQRPVSKSQQGIGSWLSVMNILGFLAVLTNASMITFVGSQDARRNGLETRGFIQRTQHFQLWLTFVVVEHFVLLLRALIPAFFPDIPAWIKDSRIILEHRLASRYRTTEQSGIDDKQRELAARQYAEREAGEYAQKLQSSFILLRDELIGKTRHDIQAIFCMWDKDGNDMMDSSELGDLLAEFGVEFTEDEIQKTMDEIDAKDGNSETETVRDGVISFDEFLNWLLTQDMWTDPAYKEMLQFWEDDAQDVFALPPGVFAAELNFYQMKAKELDLETELRGEGAARTLFVRKVVPLQTGPPSLEVLEASKPTGGFPMPVKPGPPPLPEDC
jgi:Ca2+-binding EF-hand superfamily protein